MAGPTSLDTLTGRLAAAETTDAIALSWPPVTITMSSHCGPVLDQVGHRYRNHFDITRVTTGTPDLLCVVDARLTADLLDRVAVGHRSVCGPLGRPPHGLEPVWVGARGTGKGEQAVVVREGDRRVVIVPDHSRGFGSVVARQIRAIASARLHGYGWVPVHAASVVDRGGRALVLFGPRMSGKTTTLLSLLKAGVGSLLSNDTVFLRGGDRTEARGFPVSLGVRPDTMDLFPELRLTMGFDRSGTGRRLHITTDEVMRAFRVGQAREAKVRAFVRMKFDPELTSFTLRKVERDEFERQLSEVRLDADPLWSGEWLDRGDTRREPVPAVDFAGVGVPAYEAVIGSRTRAGAVIELRDLL